jgi:hypothetical protein
MPIYRQLPKEHKSCYVNAQSLLSKISIIYDLKYFFKDIQYTSPPYQPLLEDTHYTTLNTPRYPPKDYSELQIYTTEFQFGLTRRLYTEEEKCNIRV